MSLAAIEAQVIELERKATTLEADHNEALDTIWMLLCAMLVFFMHSGFSMLEAGSVRFKNTQNILAKNLIVVTLGFLCWWAFGYPLALGVVDDPSRFGGFTNFFHANFMPEAGGPTNIFRTWFFQGAFCATGATIVSGAMAERTKLLGFGIYVVMITTFIYPIVAYWGWSGEGFLKYPDGAGGYKSIVGPAYSDFAGSGIVHMVGGIGAICGAVVVGARSGRWESANAAEFDGHSIPFCVLGTFFLWFGWYGFNPGSTLAMKTKGDAFTAGIVAANTTLAPCVSGLLVFFLRAKVVAPKCLDVGGFCNGILAGLVSITAGCGAVKSWEAILIGLFGGAIYQGASMLMKKLKIDDVVDAFPVHGACGAWGVLALGFFGDPAEGMGGNGCFYGGNQIWVQIVAICLIAIWTIVWSLLAFVPLKMVGQLRLSDEFQKAGADIMEHSPRKAYNEEEKVPEVGTTSM